MTFDAFAAAIGQELREKREATGLTQTALAVAVGVSQSTVQRVEAGVRPRDAATLDRMHAALARIERANLKAA